MGEYRKKPVVIEAVQWFPGVGHPGVSYQNPEPVAYDHKGQKIEPWPYVTTIHGWRTRIAPGDWLIKEPDGEHYYPCKPGIFEATYEPVPESSP